MKNRLPSILFLTVGWFGVQMAMALDVTKFQVMLDEHFRTLPGAGQDNAFLIALVLGLGPIAGITVQPAMGRLGDYLARRGISRATVMKIAVLVSFLGTLAFMRPVNLWGLIALVALFFTSFNVLSVNYRALITETSNRRALIQHKGTVSGGVALFSGLGGLAMFLLCSLPNTETMPFVAGALVLLLTFLAVQRFAPRPKRSSVTLAPPADSIAADAAETGAGLNLFRPWNFLFYAFPPVLLVPAAERRIAQDEAQKAIFRMFLVVFFSWFGIQALRGFFVLFAMKSLHLDFSQSNIPLAVLTLMIVAASLPIGKLADRLNNRRLYQSCLAAYALISLAGFLWANDLVSAIVMSATLGVAFAGMIILPLSLLLRMCPPKTEGTYAGLYNLFMSVPQLYSLWITGLLIDRVGDYRVILLVGFVAVSIAALLTTRLKSTN